MWKSIARRPLLTLALQAFALLPPARCVAYFERIDVSSRALAFGDAYVALADDASGVTWNPGGLGALDHLELQLSVSRPYDIPGLLSDAVTLGRPALGGVVGAGWHRIANDFIAEDVWFGTYGRWVYRDDHGVGYLGGSLKIGHVGVTTLVGTPDYGGATALTGDVGVFYRSTLGVTAGAVLRNLGEPDLELVSGSGGTPWKSAIDLGVAYRWRPESTISGSWTSAGRDRDSYHIGGEIWFYDVFAVRAGVLGTEFAGGFGLRTSRWEIDSSFVTQSQLGLSTRVTLVVPLGSKK
jgi:hypothetical protein